MTMFNSLRMLTLLGALVACSGCLKTIYMASPDGYVTTQSAEGGEYFRVRMRNDFTFWGLAPRARLVEVDRAVSFRVATKDRTSASLLQLLHVVADTPERAGDRAIHRLVGRCDCLTDR